MKQLVEEFLSRWRRKLIEHIAGGIGESTTKSQNLLELYGGIQLELIVCRCARRRTPRRSRCDRKTFLANISLVEAGFAASADAGETTSGTAAAANPRADISRKFLREI